MNFNRLKRHVSECSENISGRTRSKAPHIDIDDELNLDSDSNEESEGDDCTNDNIRISRKSDLVRPIFRRFLKDWFEDETYDETNPFSCHSSCEGKIYASQLLKQFSNWNMFHPKEGPLPEMQPAFIGTLISQISINEVKYIEKDPEDNEDELYNRRTCGHVWYNLKKSDFLLEEPETQVPDRDDNSDDSPDEEIEDFIVSDTDDCKTDTPHWAIYGPVFSEDEDE